MKYLGVAIVGADAMSLIRHKCGRSITLELASEQPEGEGWTRGRVSVTTHPSDVTTKNVTEHCRIALWAPGLRTTHLMIFLVELSHNIHRHQLLPSCFHSSVWKEMVPPRAHLVFCKDWSQQWARNPAHLPSGGERRPARPAGAPLSRSVGPHRERCGYRTVQLCLLAWRLLGLEI